VQEDLGSQVSPNAAAITSILVTPKIPTRFIPEPAGIDDPVKAKAGQAERAWEVVTGTLTFLGAGGAAALAAGVAIPPAAPFIAAVAAGSFYFKLRAKWLMEDPPRRDYDVVTEFRPPRVDVMAVLPPGPVPPGAALVSLLHVAGASIGATVVAMERATGASLAAWAEQPQPATAHAAARVREAQEHAKRSEVLTVALHAAATDFGAYLAEEIRPGPYPPRPYPPSRYASLSEMIDTRALGHLVAAGIDQRLLEGRVPWNEDSADVSVDELLASAGEAAEELGAELGRWAQEQELRPPPD
jgi:hypothetical protein